MRAARARVHGAGGPQVRSNCRRVKAAVVWAQGGLGRSRTTTRRWKARRGNKSRRNDMTAVTRRGVVSGLAAALLPVTGLAQSRIVRIVVPFAPGGGADFIARLIQPHLQQMLGQTFYIEN